MLLSRYRRWLPAAALGLLALAACTPDPAATSVAEPGPGPTVITAAPETASETTAAPSPTPISTPVSTPVPNLVGGNLAGAATTLARQGLRLVVRYTLTGRVRAGTVLAQSVRAGTGVRPATVVTLTVAKAPALTTAPTSAPPPRRTTPPPAPPPSSGCHPSYPDRCLRADAGDYDCAGGTGNGPNYVAGPLRVLSPDPFRLDADHDGIGCE
jgi:hypothetical protein